MTSSQPPRRPTGNQGQINPTLKALNAIQAELKRLNQVVANLETQRLKSQPFNWRSYLIQHAPMLVTAFLLMFVLFNVIGLHPKPASPPRYEYDVQSPNDLKFKEAMNLYGQEGWEVLFCRRALDDGKASYECILSREIRESEES